MCGRHSHKEQCKTLSQPYPVSRYKYWSTDTNVECTNTPEALHVTLNIHEMDSLYMFILYYKYTTISCFFNMSTYNSLPRVITIY